MAYEMNSSDLAPWFSLKVSVVSPTVNSKYVSHINPYSAPHSLLGTLKTAAVSIALNTG